MKGGYTTFAVVGIALNTLAAKKNVSALALITSAVAPITLDGSAILFYL